MSVSQHALSRLDKAVYNLLSEGCSHTQEMRNYVTADHVMQPHGYNMCNDCMRQRWGKLGEVVRDAIKHTELDYAKANAERLQERRFMQWTVFFQQALVGQTTSEAERTSDAAMKIWDLRRPADE